MDPKKKGKDYVTNSYFPGTQFFQTLDDKIP